MLFRSVNSIVANPGSQSSLREANRSRIVDAVKYHGGLTQVELAAVTGLSPATVSNIVKELSSSGLLHTTPTSRSGRRALHVTLAHGVGLVVGLQISNTRMRLVLADVGHQVIAERSMPLARDHRCDSELERASVLIADMVDSVDASFTEVLGIGVGLPAPIDPRTGVIVTPGLLRGWDGIPIRDELSARFGRPIFQIGRAHV